MVDHLRGQQADARVTMLDVVPGEERLAERARLEHRAEPAWKLGPVFQGLELGLGERVVVADMRPAVALGYTQVSQQERDRLGGHRGPAVSMQRQLATLDALLGAGLVDQAAGQRRALVVRDQPTYRVAAEDIEKHVQVKVCPLGWPEQLASAIPRGWAAVH